MVSPQPRGIVRHGFRALLYLLFVGAVLAFEFRDDLLEPEGSEPTEARENVVETVGYRLLTSSGYRALRSRFAMLVLLDEATEGEAVMHNVCVQRRLMARVVRNLSSARVSGIVIDKYFSDSACGSDDPGTKELLDALRSTPTAVTLGLLTRSEVGKGGEHRLKIAENNLIEPQTPPGQVRFGLVLLNHDTRKIPLRWAAELNGKLTSWPTLSYVAALRHDHGVESGLGSLLSDERHPYASFAAASAFPRTSAASVYCLDPPERPLVDCTQVPLATPADWLGRIAVVGDAEGDLHSSALGDVTGALLHANYLEALLDDRYFTPLKPLPSIFIVLLFCIVIQLMFWTTDKPERALLLCLGGLLVLGAVGYLALVQFQFMLPPVFEMGGLLVFTILRYLDTRAHALHAHSVPPLAPTAATAAPSEPPPSLPVPPIAREALAGEETHEPS